MPQHGGCNSRHLMWIVFLLSIVEIRSTAFAICWYIWSESLNQPITSKTMASGFAQMYLSISYCNTMHCTRLLSRWIVGFSCLTLLFIITIVVLCQQNSTEWILDHESELPPRVPFTLNSANGQYPGQIDRHPSLLDKEISCAENAPCCILPTSRLPEFQVVFKMGASESMDQVYSNLNHTSKCISNVLVVSDKEQKVGRFNAHDVIADLPPWYRKHNKEFKDYDNLNKPDADASSISYANGHGLDKFKFLPMIEYAYKANPTAKWFIFLEADTFIAWNNVFQLLDQYNPACLYILAHQPQGGSSHMVKRHGLLMGVLAMLCLVLQWTYFFPGQIHYTGNICHDWTSNSRLLLRKIAVVTRSWVMH